jgi:ribosome-associated toxin RatA of RatAB toxin-antitoxin module
MPSVTQTEIFNCKPEVFFKIISDYEKYPEFLPEIKDMKVLKVEGSKKLVEYTVSVIKTFKYRLWMYETPNQSIKWEFVGGDLFKTSVGSWTLEPVEGGNKTKATYFVDVTFNVLVPSPVAKALVNVNLPSMMAAYHKRVANYG